jgi:hypothetical protein
MRYFILTFVVGWALSLTNPPVVTAGSFSSSVVKHGGVDSGISVQQLPFVKHGGIDSRISARRSPFVKHVGMDKRIRTHRHWRRGHFLYPFYGSYRDTKPYQKRTRPRKGTVYTRPYVLDQEIFNPSPKTPLTLVIEDGVIVNRYFGYK